MIIDMMMSPIKELDENKCFYDCIQYVNSVNHEFLKEVNNKLSEAQKDFLEKQLRTKKLHLVIDGQEKDVTRRIVKVKRVGK